MLRSIRQKSLHTQILKRFQSTSSQETQYHAFPEIPHLTKFKEVGIPGLFSAKGFQTAYYDRVGLHLDQLNKELSETSNDTTHDLNVLVDELAKSSKEIKVFNNASLVYNISFAFGSIGGVRGTQSSELPKATVESLLKTPDVTNEISNIPNPDLLKKLEESFGSLIEFKTLLLNSANAINGDGFTWVVARGTDHITSPSSSFLNSDSLSIDRLFILNTYNAGSPNNSNKAGILQDLESQLSEPSLYGNTIISIDEAKNIKSYDPKITYRPILALDASPKSYLHDYGVFGKRQYLEQLWNSIDWEIVNTRVPEFKQKAI